VKTENVSGEQKLLLLTSRFMISYYQIVMNKIFFCDRRFDQFRKPIISLFEQLECTYNSNFPEEVIKEIIRKRKDCEHKLTAVRYALTLIQVEIGQKISDQEVREYSEMIKNRICGEAELKNEVLMYETEAFLFQVKSSLDILIQLLKNIPNYRILSSGGTTDRESFDIDSSSREKSTVQKIREANNPALADYLEGEIDLWIRDLNKLRNEITHRSGLQGFTSFVYVSVYVSSTGSLVDPKMPDGTAVDQYCADVYTKLFALFEKVIAEFVIPKIPMK
jgi:hypothetical protein